jgi:uncharacterized protein YggL (DUF469 family)
MSAPCPALGFVITIALRPNVSDADIDTLVDDLLDFLESHGLQSGGAGEMTLEFVVITREGGQVTDADRGLVREWSARWSDHAEISVGEIVDLSDQT